MDWLTEKMHARDFTVSALVRVIFEMIVLFTPACWIRYEMMAYHLSGLTIMERLLLLLTDHTSDQLAW